MELCGKRNRHRYCVLLDNVLLRISHIPGHAEIEGPRFDEDAKHSTSNELSALRSGDYIEQAKCFLFVDFPIFCRKIRKLMFAYHGMKIFKNSFLFHFWVLLEPVVRFPPMIFQHILH